MVPCFCPKGGILVDLIQEKVVEEPDVSGAVNIKPSTGFQVGEKGLPFFTEPFRNIIPDPLYPGIMDTPCSVMP